MTALVFAETIVIALLAVLVAGLLRSHAEILRALHDLGVGIGEPRDRLRSVAPGVATPRTDTTPAVDVAGATPSGGAAKIGVVGAAHSTLLAFLSSGCTSCSAFWEAFRDPRLTLPGTDTRLVVVTKGPEAESASRLVDLAPPTIPVVMTSAAWDDFRVPVSPYFILVDGPTGSVTGEGSAASWRQVASLLEQALADAGAATAPRPNDTSRAGRLRRADEDLQAAGIHPGHPSLYPDSAPEDPGRDQAS